MKSSCEELGIRINHLYLEKLKLACQGAMSPELIDAMYTNEPKVRVMEDIMSDNLVCTIVNYLTAHQVDRYEVKYPANWWEALKDRWFTHYMKWKWPVKYTVYKLDVKEILSKIKFPKGTSTLVIPQIDKESQRRWYKGLVDEISSPTS